MSRKHGQKSISNRQRKKSRQAKLKAELERIRKHSTNLNLGKSLYEIGRVDCHKGTISVFKDPKTGITFNGGGRSRNVKLRSDCIIVDVGVEAYSKVTLFGLPMRNPMAKYQAKIIKLDWDDMTTPSWSRNFWEALLKTVRQSKMDVIVSCLGGHGRTGTALSILAGLTGASNGADPVQFIRDKYCDQAVETNNQLKYIEKITGMLVKAKCAHVGDWSTMCESQYAEASEKVQNDDDDADYLVPEHRAINEVSNQYWRA